MAVLCDGQHEHDSWGMVKDKWATSLETAYPWPLAKAMAQCIRSQLESAGVSFPATRLQDLDHVVQASRAYSGVQTRKRLPPLVPEFRQIVTLHGSLPIPPAGLEPGSKLMTDYHVPSVCTAEPPCNIVPAGSKVIRALLSKGVGQCSDQVEGSKVNAVHFSGIGQCSDHVEGSKGNAVHSSDQVGCSTDHSEGHALFQSPGQVAGIANYAEGHALWPSNQGEDMSKQVRGHTLPPPRLGFGVALKNPDPSLGAHAVIPRPPESAAEAEVVAFDILSEGFPVSTAQVQRLFDLLPDSDMQSIPVSDGNWADGNSKCFITGAYVFNGTPGIRNTVFEFPCVTAALTSYVTQLDPCHAFTSVALFRNLRAVPHADVHNEAGSVSLISPVNAFAGGDLWVARPGGSCSLLVNGKELEGTILPVSRATQRFDPRAVHATLPWEGQRDVLVAFTPDKRNSLSEDDLNYLCVLGFRAFQAGSPQHTSQGTAPTPAHSHAQGKVTFGVYHDPQEFVAAACKVQHPSNLEILVPDMLREAVKRNVSTPADVLARGRTETIRKWIAWGNELQLEEENLKASLSPLRAKVLKGKRLKLFGKVLAEIHHQDEGLVDDICSGFSLTGRLPRSEVFRQVYRPASLTVDMLRAGAARARAATLATCVPSEDPVVDQGVEEATMKEVEAGVVEGPIPIGDIPSEATLTRRFGVIQSHVDGQPKVRPIDDYKASQVNACVTQTEQVTIHSMDVVAGTVAYWLKCAGDASSDSSIMAKCWDLKSAYKQLPLDDTSREMDGHFVIFSPTANAPQVFRQLVLPFGSIASVTGFIRSAMGLWAIAISQLSLVWTMYFDDFLHISHSALCKHSDLIISVFFQLFGWRVSEDKLLAYSGCCKALGVLIDMRQAAFGVVKFTNTESRIAELLLALERAISSKNLIPKECERLKGRLQFASGQLFGRRARSCLKILGQHARQRSPALSKEAVRACKHLHDLFLGAAPREIRGALGDVLHCYVDASFEPNMGYSGVGGCLFSGSGTALAWFGCEMDQEVLDLILRSEAREKKTAIYELECLAVAIALDVFSSHLSHRNIVLFTDNEGVHGTLVRCWSDNRIGDGLARMVCASEERLRAMLWYERVPSHSNPADRPSRGVAPEGSFAHRSEVEASLPKKLITDSLVPDAKVKG